MVSTQKDQDDKKAKAAKLNLVDVDVGIRHAEEGVDVPLEALEVAPHLVEIKPANGRPSL